MQHESRHFRTTIQTQQMLARNAATDVHQRRLLEKRAAIVATAVATRHQQRTEERQTDLAAVHVPGEHQVNLVPSCPSYRVGTVAQTKTKHPVLRARNLLRTQCQDRLRL